MPVASASGPVPGEKELLIMQNLFDGNKKLRLLDIKIGQYTADANWRGKSSFAAYRQGILDGKTNSTKEGYRMEGFDGPPPELATFDPSVESKFMGAAFSVLRIEPKLSNSHAMCSQALYACMPPDELRMSCVQKKNKSTLLQFQCTQACILFLI